MVSPRRAGAEVRRELARSSSLWVLVAALAFTLLATLFAGTQAGLELLTPAVYLVLPLAMVPLAAYRAARDRERGLADAHATTPIEPSDVLAGKLVALVALLGAILLATLPSMYALTQPAATGSALLQLLPMAAWGLVIGTTGIVVGLVIGYARPGASTGALSVGSLVTLAWFVAPVLRADLYALASSPTQLTLVRAVLHTSPFTWATEVLDTESGLVVPDTLGHLAGLGLLTLVLLVGLVAIATRLQHVAGWRANPLRQPAGATLLCLSLVAAGGLLVAWDYPPPGPATSAPTPPAALGGPSPIGQATLGDVHLKLAVEDAGAWHQRSPATTHLYVTGEPNATVRLEALAFTSPDLAVEPDPELALPREIPLDETVPASAVDPDAPDNETAGRGHLRVPTTISPNRIVHTAPVNATVTIDGATTTLPLTLSTSRYELATTPAMATGGVLLAALVALSLIAPRRMNRW